MKQPTPKNTGDDRAMLDELIKYEHDPEGRFVGLPLCVKQLDRRMYKLERDVTYFTEDGELLTVMAPFRFDFASVPRFLWWLYPPKGTKKNPYGIAALIHDWLLKHKKIGGRKITRPEADAIFLEVMLYTGCRKTLCRTMYTAVGINTFLKRMNPWREKWPK